MNWHDIFERAAWTFAQGAVTAVGVVPAFTDITGWKSIGVAAISGGVAALFSFIKTVIQENAPVVDTR